MSQRHLDWTHKERGNKNSVRDGASIQKCQTLAALAASASAIRRNYLSQQNPFSVFNLESPSLPAPPPIFDVVKLPGRIIGFLLP